MYKRRLGVSIPLPLAELDNSESGNRTRVNRATICDNTTIQTPTFALAGNRTRASSMARINHTTRLRAPNKNEAARRGPSLRENFTTKLQGRHTGPLPRIERGPFPKLAWSGRALNSRSETSKKKSFLPGSNRRPLRCNDYLFAKVISTALCRLS